MTLRKPLLYAFSIALGLMAATGAIAWTGPSVGAPGGNASAPLNVSGSGQTKAGGLRLNSGGAANGLEVISGTTLLNSFVRVGAGSSANTEYLMVNTPSGTSAGIQLFQTGVESWIIKNPAASSDLTFSASGAERMRITTGGSVGIGSAAPLAKLQVTGTSVATDPGNGATGIFSITVGTGSNLDAKLEFGVYEAGGTGYSWLQALNANSGWRNLVLNATGGNVGIGTTAPGQKLDVNGQVRATDVCTTAGKCLSAVAVGHTFGGGWSQYSSGSYGCYAPNPATGGCSCPAGMSAYSYGNSSYNGSAYNMYLCY